MKNHADNRWMEGDALTAEFERVAAEWFFRRDGEVTPEEEKLFQDWLRQDERHRRAYSAVEGTWGVMKDAQDLVLPPAPDPRMRSKKIAWLPVALAAAAAVVIAALGWQRNIFGSSVYAGAAATEVGGLRTMKLPDGSVITLNASSAVEVQFTASERRVRLLQGEAHFTVAKNPRRPFAVEAGGVAVKAVGTAFNVRLRSETVEVLVTEGKVRVDDAIRGDSLLFIPGRSLAVAGDPERLLVSGERVIIPVSGDTAPLLGTADTVSASEIKQALSWQHSQLDYFDAPLSQIVEDFNHHNRHRLVIADPALGARRFGGSFPAKDYDSLVQVLEKTFGVVAERRDGETILRLP